MASQFPDSDNWLSEHRPPSLVGRFAYAAGRAVDLVGVLIVGGLSALLIGGLLILLLIEASSGVTVATVLILIAMAGVLLGFLGFRQRTRRVAIVREGRRVAAGLGSFGLGSADVNQELASLEAERIQRLAHLTLRSGAALSSPLRSRLNAASTATRDALRSTAVGGVLTREAHDARQAADDDLPAALATYQDLRVTGAALSYGEVLLSEQLGLIERRMRAISEAQAAGHTRKLEAGKRYLSVKYGEREEGPE
ncbi:hypothetical protein [Deinococcus sp.]|uniref:hypothetical protein n=1 Tax=Deinococcus sp. TaxID=47478 RepID=UPI0025EFFEB5|nr:hypothetical protein [Deinococcus sp.]